MDQHKETPSQTAGPYLHIGCLPKVVGIQRPDANLGSTVRRGSISGPPITVEGVITDGTGALVTDAMVELWQADATGLYPSDLETRGKADPNFLGWARSGCDPDSGLFQFETIKPGARPLPDGTQNAPHITFWIVARGINIGLHTRMYFPQDQTAHQRDPLLGQLVDPDRRGTLICKKTGDHAYRFDICLQGAAETVFLDI
ncbi:protocatechuate 3,4-dioxygenase subunit alpha [Yoonia sp. SS1-5]|uniref:Protocatechuate 3,4-dioxygenase subunit alpha n=1 Tax=Yoonia rhodophyticola TaxID=3137370 RepID=A0AAN0MD70_9RHOB